jgi:Ca2+-binding EF-hand superfamily protein
MVSARKIRNPIKCLQTNTRTQDNYKSAIFGNHEYYLLLFSSSSDEINRQSLGNILLKPFGKRLSNAFVSPVHNPGKSPFYPGEDQPCRLSQTTLKKP